MVTAPDRERAGALATGAGRPDDELAGVLVRARAAGGSWDAVHDLAALWPTLRRRERATVASPLGGGRPGLLRLGDAPARQTDATTCGSAVLTLLAAAGDPFLALWLATGRTVGAHLPPELRGARPADLALPDAAARLGAVQRAVKRVSTRRALGPLPWPGALGTPPWGAARTARFAGLRFRSVLVDDTDTAHLARVLDAADAALAAGVPVPLYTGGDLSTGLTTALPRHVVLLVPRDRPDHADADDPDTATGATTADDGRLALYEPGSGRVHAVRRTDLLAPAGPQAALGGWSHVCWAVLPDGVAAQRHGAGVASGPAAGR